MLWADSDAGGEVIRFYFDQLGDGRAAFGDSERTTCVKMTAARRVDR